MRLTLRVMVQEQSGDGSCQGFGIEPEILCHGLVNRSFKRSVEGFAYREEAGLNYHKVNQMKKLLAALIATLFTAGAFAADAAKPAASAAAAKPAASAAAKAADAKPAASAASGAKAKDAKKA